MTIRSFSGTTAASFVATTFTALTAIKQPSATAAFTTINHSLSRTFQAAKLTKLTTMAMEWQELNSDKTLPIHIDSDTLTWTNASQAKSGGVYRKMLERKGDEVARATTIVKFDPHQEFPRHTHTGGEEFIVLEGTWHDDYGAFPQYTYVRNYIGSSHTPSIKEDGCTILVKLRQMSKMSEEPETRSWPLPELWELKYNRETGGELQKYPLFSSPLERTYAVYFKEYDDRYEEEDKKERVLSIPPHGLEMFVMEGSLTSKEASTGIVRFHNRWSWTRLPNDTSVAQTLSLSTDHVDGAYVWIKEGHLDSDEVGV